jgi:alpha 1,2-mannosyltransferase
LRKFSHLPVELFYAGHKEMPPEVKEQWIKEFRFLNLRDITQIELTQKYPFLPITNYKGYQIKPYAILHSSFREVLYIDADNVILESPDFLFESPEYRETGALFWPDFHTMKSTHKKLLQVFGIAPDEVRGEVEFESGQMLINKEKCWKALLTVCLVNSDNDDFRSYCYRHTNGDKDTFRLSFRFARAEHTVISRRPLPIGTHFIAKIQHEMGSFDVTGMLQHDPQGKPLFVHRTVYEWNLYYQIRALAYLKNHNEQVEKSPELETIEDEGNRYINEFKQKYLPKFRRDYKNMLLGILHNIAVGILDLLFAWRKNR